MTLKASDVVRGVVVDGIDDEGRGRAVVAGADDADGVDGAFDVAVRGAMPGDVCDVVVERVFAARGLAQARRLGPLGPDAGPLHVERRCRHAGPCAACPLHGVDRDFVLAMKTERVRQAVVDAGLDDGAVQACVTGSPYRQKIKLMAEWHNGTLTLGHYTPHSHVLSVAEGCAATDDEMQAATQALKARLEAHADAAASVVAVIMRRFEEGLIAVVVARGPCPVPLNALWPESLLGLSWRRQDAAASENAIVGGHVDVAVGAVLGTPLGGGAPCVVDAFCQADAVGAAWLVDRASDFVVDGIGADDVVYDLYAGSGAFARVLAARLNAGHADAPPRVIAVERFGASAEALSALPGVFGICGAVEDALDDVLGGHGQVSGAVVDPPKKGLGPVAARLAAHPSLRRVAVVSCDVDAGARDVRAFVDAGFVVDAFIPVDLFAGSAEVELLSLLRRP